MNIENKVRAILAVAAANDPASDLERAAQDDLAQLVAGALMDLHRIADALEILASPPKSE